MFYQDSIHPPLFQYFTYQLTACPCISLIRAYGEGRGYPVKPIGRIPTVKIDPVGTVPTDKMHPVGTQIFSSYFIFSLNLDCIAKINDRSWHLFFDLSVLSLISLLLPTLLVLPLPTSPFYTLPCQILA